MNQNTTWRKIAPALLAGLLVVGCSDDEQSDSKSAETSAPVAQTSGLLAHIPDSTPYLAANTRPVDEGLMDLMWKLAEPGMQQADEAFDQVVKDLAENAEKSDKDRLAEAVMMEFDGRMNRAGFAELGLDSAGNFAIYGLGVVPVLRADVVDATRLQATIDRIEQNAGQNFPKHSLGGVTYYEFADHDGVIVAAIQGNELVVSALPSNLKDALLPQILGIEKPANSIAKSGRLDAVNSEFGFNSSGTVVIDSNRLVDAIFDDQSEASVALFGEGRKNLGPACEAEFRSLAATAPRLVSGTTSVSDQAIDQLMVLELRADLAQGLQAIKAAIPGLGSDDDGMMYMAMGLNLIQAKKFVADRAAAVLAEPYQCAELLELNANATLSQQQTGQPLPPFVSNLRGLRVNLKDAQMGPGMAMNFNGQAMVSMDNPQLVLGMAQAFVPQLAELQLGLDGVPVALPEGLAPMPLDAPHVAMVESGIGFSLGEGQQTTLQAFLTADAPHDPPFMSMGYDAAAMAAFQRSVMGQFAPDDAQAPPMTGLESIDRITGIMDFTGRGVEMTSTTHLNP